jgi:hypothetical protein
MIFMGSRLIMLGLVLGALPVTVSWAGNSDRDPWSSARPFQIGEQFTYEISWMNIKAGTAVMGVTTVTEENHPLVKLVTTAQSRPAITKFFPVDNRVESILNPETMLPEHLTFRRREGKKNEDMEYTFDQKKGTVIEVKGGSTETLPILPHTHDAISCLYYVRSELTPRPGWSLTMNVHHDRKNYTLNVLVEKVETIRGAWGELETVRVLVVMPFQGIFLNQGNIRVWFTNDARRIPLRMKAKVIIGSLVADLVTGLPASSRAP